ncbi:hypothetical protein DL769_006772 [Monosporascus sp. CRB-8-3]|nr:hypothetical protein DL769_006772 [Monosporascus sp. CRB-8-3]
MGHDSPSGVDELRSLFSAFCMPVGTPIWRPAFFYVLDAQQELAGEATSSSPLLTDVGGVEGSQCIVFRQRYPDLAGRVILQYLPYVAGRIKGDPLPGFEDIEIEAHDFSKPESGLELIISGPPSRLGRCRVRQDLGTTEESVILIDEADVSERSAPWRAAQQDMEMSFRLSVMEHTGTKWRTLIDEAGPTTRGVRRYTEEYEDTVIAVAPK